MEATKKRSDGGMKTFNLFRSLLFIVVLLILSVFPILPVSALDWHSADQATAAWDAVGNLASGNPVPATDIVEYSVYLTNFINPIKDSSVVIWRGAGTETIVKITGEGSFYLGVRAHRIRDGTEISSSIVAWSDNPLYTNDLPWGLRFFFPMAPVSGIVKK